MGPENLSLGAVLFETDGDLPLSWASGRLRQHTGDLQSRSNVYVVVFEKLVRFEIFTRPHLPGLGPKGRLIYQMDTGPQFR